MSTQETRPKRRLTRLAIIMIVVFVFICGLTVMLIRAALTGERREPIAVLEGAEVGTLVELPGDTAYPESLTAGLDGNIYVGSFCTGEIWRITPEGERTTFLNEGINSVAGLAFAPESHAEYPGWLYVIDHGDCDPRRSTSRLKRVSPDGETVETAGNISDDDIPNALTFDDEGVLYLTDTQNGTVRKMVNDSFDTWWEVPSKNDNDPRPTGLTYDNQTDSLIVADTQAGIIYRVTLGAGREPGTITTLYEESSSEIEGLTMDDEGRVIVTFIGSHQIGRIEPDNTITILAEDFREPSDVAYLNNTIYVTNFDGVSLAPFISWFLDPSLPFTVDYINLPVEAAADNESEDNTDSPE